MFTQTGPMTGFWSGTGFVSHFDGTAWSPIRVLTFNPPSISEPIVRIWELAPNDVWALTALTLQSPVFAGTGRWHFDGATWTGTQAHDVPEAFMFPAESGSGTFVFGPHDRWRVGVGGLWQRNTQ